VVSLSSNKDVIIKAPSLRGGGITVRTQINELKITFEMDQLKSGER